jgi:hypothetical protein
LHDQDFYVPRMMTRLVQIVRTYICAWLFAAIISCLPALAGSGPPVPDPADLITLVQDTIMAVAEGNANGDYAALHAMGTPAFQTENPPGKLAGGFAALRASGFDLSSVRNRTPLTTRSPTLDRNGRLRILGYYDLLDRQVVYDVLYDYDEAQGRWRLASISVTPRVLPPQPQLMQPE